LNEEAGDRVFGIRESPGHSQSVRIGTDRDYREMLELDRVENVLSRPIVTANRLWRLEKVGADAHSSDNAELPQGVDLVSECVDAFG